MTQQGQDYMQKAGLTLNDIVLKEKKLFVGQGNGNYMSYLKERAEKLLHLAHIVYKQKIKQARQRKLVLIKELQEEQDLCEKILRSKDPLKKR